MQHKKQILSFVTALGLGLSLGWLLPAQQAPAAKGPQVKDTAEYDLVLKYQGAKDAKGKIEALEKWKQGYPESEFKSQWDDEFLNLHVQAKDARKAFDKAKELRGKNPNHFLATYYIMQFIYALGNPPAAPDLAAAEQASKHVNDNSATYFAPANKPAGVTDQQWPSYRPIAQNLAMKTYAWIWVQRKDDRRAEVELTNYLKFDPSQGQFSSFLATAQFNQRQTAPEKQVTALFHFARAATFDTPPNALPAAGRQQLLQYVTNTYEQYHGSKEGLEQVIAVAKANVMPPAGFTIKSKNELVAAEIEKDEEWKKAHPDLAIWRDTVKGPLLGDDGAAYFDSTIKDAEIPGGLNGVTAFKAVVHSMNPPLRPKQLIVAVYDPAVPDATLEFEEPLPGDMPAGAMIEFNGVGKSFTKEPFNVTFTLEREKLTGWTGEDAKGKGKGGPKGPPKAPAKGK